MFSRIRARRRRTDDLAEELERHFQELKQERLELGDTEAQADRFARLKLGNRTKVHEAVHEMSSFYSIEAWGRNLQLAGRTIWRHKSAYLSAVAILALGIG